MSEQMLDAIAKVELPGIFSTIQDRGRYGARRYGIPSSGALDLKSYYASNLLLGNARDAPAVEVLGGNFSLIFSKETSVAITGARCKAYLDKDKIELDEKLEVKSGSRILLSISEYGFANYVAVAGGFWGELILNSRSTYVPGSFGGSWGRVLRKGDILYGLNMKGEREVKASRFELKERLLLHEGPHCNREIMEWMTSQSFVIRPESDRMGFRLLPKVEFSSALYHEIITMPVFPGMVQLTKGGELLVVNKDGQTTGGYPVIAIMEEEELGSLVQLGPGAEASFWFVK